MKLMSYRIVGNNGMRIVEIEAESISDALVLWKYKTGGIEVENVYQNYGHGWEPVVA